jgi:hypothetical protein
MLDLLLTITEDLTSYLSPAAYCRLCLPTRIAICFCNALNVYLLVPVTTLRREVGPRWSAAQRLASLVPRKGSPLCSFYPAV